MFPRISHDNEIRRYEYENPNDNDNDNACLKLVLPAVNVFERQDCNDDQCRKTQHDLEP